MNRITLGEFRKRTKDLPDDAILCCMNDSEGNEISTCWDIFVEKVGTKRHYDDGATKFDYVEGDNIYNVNVINDADKIIITLQPVL